ncbi:MAG TPA: TIR domain-containing protein [Anaerolineales bacterium]|nr:TIR domain-containing protein [Anaerolineales bacterium]
MASLFISYSRKDLEVARKLTGALQGQDLDFWIDWEGIPPTVDWWQEIQKGIEEADIFLFLLSPDSATSKVCREEIEHAVKNGKRLIPLVVRDVKGETPAALSSLNWIFLRAEDDFNLAFGKLITAIKTDYAWVQAHRQLQVKALEWDRSSRENSFLLRGKELSDAELQLATNTSKEPHPTDLQREYVLRSRQAGDRQRRSITAIAIVGLIALAALAIFAFVQAGLARTAEATAVANASVARTAEANAVNNENARATAQAQAEERQRIARSGELAAQSAALRGTQFDLSLLLAVDAIRTADTRRTRSTLLDSAQAKPELSQYLRGHTDAARSLAFSPNGKILASGSDDNTIILWDVATRKPIAEPLRGHTDFVLSLAFSPDGKTLASGSWDSTVILWDVATGQKIGQPLRGHAKGKNVNSVAFSPDGKMLASASDDATIILWDVATHQQLGKPLQANTGSVISATFSPDGKMLASGGWDNAIILWDLATRQPIGGPLTGHYQPVNSVAFSPDGTLLASGSDDNYIILWDVATHQLLAWLVKHTDDVNKVAFTSDGKTLISSSFDNTLIRWDVASRTLIGQPLTGQLDLITVAISPDQNIIASGGGDGTIILWDLSAPPPIGRRLLKHTDWVHSVAFSPDGKMLASSSCSKPAPNNECRQGEIILWDVSTLLNTSLAARPPIGQTLTAHADTVRSLAFSPDGKMLASGSADRTIILWDVATLQRISTLLAPDWVTGLAFSPDGKLLASGSQDESAMLWDVATRQPIRQRFKGSSVAFSPDDKMLASGTGFDIVLWNAMTLQPIGEPLKGHTGSITSLSFSPDGKTLASASADGTSILWDLATGQAIGKPLRGYTTTSSGEGVAFSPDGKMLAFASSTIHLWDLETQPPLDQLLIGHKSLVNSVAFSPDGMLLASGSADRTIILWNLDVQAWIKISCQRVNRNLTRAEWAEYFPGEEYRATCPELPLDPELAITATPTP